MPLMSVCINRHSRVQEKDGGALRTDKNAPKLRPGLDKNCIPLARKSFQFATFSKDIWEHVIGGDEWG